ncbi:dolichol kinase [Lentinula edodes]|uniref:Dolichol kinase n=1 Tax=Lentinula edodes TaxID=5353 RepID=A0A1Q3E4L9_LENED|nr:dolichol kinase [Lentinula edodes]
MSVDARKAGESLILIGSLVYASSKIWEELHCLVGATVLYRVAGATLDSERKSVPRSAGKRLSYFIVFTLGTTICMLGIKFTLVYFSLGIWQHLNWFEITVASLFYQCTLYGVVRLAHRGFTLGELGIVSFGDLAINHTLHQNLSTSYSPPYIPNRINRGLLFNWFRFISIPHPVSTHWSATG